MVKWNYNINLKLILWNKKVEPGSESFCSSYNKDKKLNKVITWKVKEIANKLFFNNRFIMI